jgi:general secretion pathway protein A
MYLGFYGLREMPFNVTSDPGFLYMSQRHEEALKFLIYGVTERKGFLELTGEVGAGKTTICRALIEHLDASVRTALILNSSLSELQLYDAILEDFGLVPARRTKIAMIRALNAFLLEETRLRHNVLLILDEAQGMTTATLEAVRLLSNLETQKEKLFQIVLAGQPQLRQKLDSPALLQLRQRIGIRLHIGPLTAKEVGPYIRHRLHVAGAGETVRFTEGAVHAVALFSGGIPRLINLVCDRALLLGFVLESREITESMIASSIREVEGESVNLDEVDGARVQPATGRLSRAVSSVPQPVP